MVINKRVIRPPTRTAQLPRMKKVELHQAAREVVEDVVELALNVTNLKEEEVEALAAAQGASMTTLMYRQANALEIS